MKQFDLIVIGSGSGLEVSAAAADRGLSVAVIEEGPFGGTCLNRGCIPSKMLIHSADVMDTIRSAHRFGIHVSDVRVDWEAIVRRVAEEVDRDAAQVEEGNRNAPNITVFKGSAVFVGEKTIEVNGERLTAPQLVIAAGTRPAVPPVPGLEKTPYLTSDTALRLSTQPERLIIFGGGAIAAELAHFFGALGTRVTIIQRSAVLLSAEDDDVSRVFTEVYRRKFDVLTGATVSRVEQHERGVVVRGTVQGRETEVVGDALLVATGRRPNSDLLRVERTGVAVDERGFIRTDEHMETNVPGIWALGDIVGRYLLKHNANLEAAYVANNVLNPDRRIPVDYHAMPQAVFASPQVASVGLTEREAREQKVPFETATYRYMDTAYGSSIRDEDGFVKVLAHRETGEILGCHILGTDASTLIQGPANAMRSRLGVDSILQSIYVHPALPEVIQRAFGELSL